jgi:uncharacterized protein (DUF433 family)
LCQNYVFNKTAPTTLLRSKRHGQASHPEISFGETEMDEQTQRRIQEIFEKMMASWEANSKDPIKQEKARREKEEERRNESREDYIKICLENGDPYPGQLELELHEMSYDHGFSEEFMEEVYMPVMLLYRFVALLMRRQGELTEEQVVWFENNIKLQILIDAAARHITPELFLAIYKATPLERLSEAIKQYRPVYASHPGISFGATEMTAPSKKTEREIIDEMMASWEANSKDPVKQEKARREREEERRNESREDFINSSLFNGYPYPSQLELELHELSYDNGFSEEFMEQVYTPVMLLYRFVALLMRRQGELTEEQVVGFENNIKLQILIDAAARNITPELFLEIYKATPLERLSEAIKQYRPVYASRPGISFGVTEMTAPSKKTEREIIDEMMASMRAWRNDPVKQEEARREREEERRNEFREDFINSSLFNGDPFPSQLELELHEMSYDHDFSEEFMEQVHTPVMLLYRFVALLMRRQGELTEEQVVEFENNIKLQILIDAAARNITPEQFLEIYKATPLEHLSEAIKQYQPAA